MDKFFYKKNGFTLTELLVVVAILALLVTIGVTNTNAARSKAKDSVIKTNLNSLRSGGELWANANGTYAGFCADNNCDCAVCSTDWKNVCSAVKVQNGNQAVNCTFSVQNDRWCASSQLVGSPDYYCVDSINKAQTQAAACSNGSCQ
ncbi:MAG: type II secretion system protein [Parcubacteria group bacterium]